MRSAAPVAVLFLIVTLIGAVLGVGADVLVWPFFGFLLSGPTFLVVNLIARHVRGRDK